MGGRQQGVQGEVRREKGRKALMPYRRSIVSEGFDSTIF